jgi:hypothetical protein
MSKKMIPVEESFAAWRKDPEYEKTYNALEEEFALAVAMIEARARAGLAQQQLAERMQYDPGGDRTSRKRPGKAVDAHARTPRRSDGHAATDFVRAGARELIISLPAGCASRLRLPVDLRRRQHGRPSVPLVQAEAEPDRDLDG